MDWKTFKVRFLELYPDVTDAELETIPQADRTTILLAIKQGTPVGTIAKQLYDGDDVSTPAPAGTTKGYWDTNPEGAVYSSGAEWWQPGGLLGRKKQYYHSTGALTSTTTTGAGTTKDNQWSTDPLTGWQTATSGGTTYLRKPILINGVPTGSYGQPEVVPVSAPLGPMPSATSDQPYILANGSWQRNRDYISPADLAAQERQRQQDLFDQAQAGQQQANIINKIRAEAATQGDYASGFQQGAIQRADQAWGQEGRPVVNFPENKPVNWIETWKAQQAANQPGTREAAGYYTGKLNQTGDWAWNRLAERAGIDQTPQQVWEGGVQRPETASELAYRTQEVPVRDLARGYLGEQPNLPALWNNVSPEAQRALAGPQLPAWAGGVTMPQTWYDPRIGAEAAARGVELLNLGTLGQTGNVVRPVSAQMYGGWAPSQQQAYQGLASAQRYQGGQPYNWEDEKANIERMWGASRRGDLAVQKPWSY